MPSPAYELSPCPACGADDEEEVAGPDAVRAEVEALWEFHTRRLRPGTPPEHLFDRVAFSQHPPLRVARCTRCGRSWWTTPRSSPRASCRWQPGTVRDRLRSTSTAG